MCIYINVHTHIFEQLVIIKSIININCGVQIDLAYIFTENSGLVSLFNGISTLFRLFNAKAILLEEQ